MSSLEFSILAALLGIVLITFLSVFRLSRRSKPLDEANYFVAERISKPKWDLIVLGVIFVLYGQFLFLKPFSSSEGGVEKELSVLGVFGNFFVQLLWVVPLVFLVIQRASIRQFFLLKWVEWKLFLKLVLQGLVMAFVAFGGLTVLGYFRLLDKWVPSKPQEIVSILANPDTPLSLIISLVLGSVVLAPFLEEFIFRGYCYPVVKRWTGKWTAMALTSCFFFAVIHMNVTAVLPLFILSMVLTWCYEKGRSLWIPIVTHSIFNLLTVLAQLFQRNFTS